MSKEQTESTGRKGREWSPSFKRKVKGYVGDNFEFKVEEISGTITPATDIQSAYNLGLSQDEMVRALNNAAKQKLIDAETEKALGADVVPESVLMKFIEPYRSVKRFAAIEKKAEQTAAIIAKIKTDEDMIEALRAAVAASKDEETE